MQAYIIKAGSKSLDDIRLEERDKPAPGPGEILVAMKACSLNYRDLRIPTGKYPGGSLSKDTVALSDGAGEVIETGAGVTRFKVGDRVAGTFFRNFTDSQSTAVPGPALGGDVDGVLAEYVVFNQADAVQLPANLSYQEGATLPCAAVTAWNALFVAGRPLKAGQRMLTLGTGGVSLFALQFAKAAGAEIFITSSSDSKLGRARQLGAHHLINYSAWPEWQDEVMRLSEGMGVHSVIDLGGMGTLERSMLSLAQGGKVAMIGVLSGREGQVNPFVMMFRSGNLHGIYVGSRSMFEDMNRAIEINDIHPVIDRVFGFDEALAAYRYMESQAHFGKVVISF